jgi:hypothetical protein
MSRAMTIALVAGAVLSVLLVGLVSMGGGMMGPMGGMGACPM